MDRLMSNKILQILKLLKDKYLNDIFITYDIMSIAPKLDVINLHQLYSLLRA